jgi:hypothetical protein
MLQWRVYLAQWRHKAAATSNWPTTGQRAQGLFETVPKTCHLPFSVPRCQTLAALGGWSVWPMHQIDSACETQPICITSPGMSEGRAANIAGT